MLAMHVIFNTVVIEITENVGYYFLFNDFDS